VRFRNGEQKNGIPFDEFMNIVVKAVAEKAEN
jgi:small nuclear ribonucleoprotein (snRNP)-like protein